MKSSEILNAAADMIEIHGWRTGPHGWFNLDGRGYCIEGAIWAAHKFQPSLGELGESPAVKAVSDYLGLGDRPYFRMPRHWNDRLPKESGKQTVVETLRAAALIESSKEETETKVKEPA